MNRFISTTIFAFILGGQLLAMDKIGHSDLEELGLDIDGITVAQALDFLNQAKEQKIGWETLGITATTTFFCSAVFDVLGAMGVGFTCPDKNSYEAFPLLCGISVAGLSVGGVLLVATIGIPTGVLIYNYRINEQNKPNDALCAILQEIDKDKLLLEEIFETFINVIKFNKRLLLEVEDSLNDNQRLLFEKIFHHQDRNYSG